MVRRKFRKLLVVITFGILPVIFMGSFLIFSIEHLKSFNRQLVRDSEVQQEQQQEKCRDWHDYEFIRHESSRTGFGEQGEGVHLTDPAEIELNDKLYTATGFAVVISDKISVNRSIWDRRPSQCKSLRYPSKLPKVSVIIIFMNEVKSVLLRTIHSVINRTPTELLHEVILVNDHSTNEELYEPLQDYVEKNFKGKVKIKNLKERKGLIVTRLEGARIATGEVLVFFDSHIEVGTNWLPPLLAPIANNRRLATIPVVDDFSSKNFETSGYYEFGSRGGIDWSLIYHNFDRFIPEGVDAAKPFPNPIMLGCAFAIDRIFFLDELGGYDEEFQIWNGENYELSFKLWLCADGLFEVPCSRVTHSFRLFNPSRVAKDDFVGRNFKRLAEVWLDEYKEVVYKWDPHRYEKIDPGDLTKPKAIRERLNCKPFSYFMEEIAPDILTRYPMTEDQPAFATGQIKSLAFENICIDTLYQSEFDPIGLYECGELDKLGRPHYSQFFRLTFMKNIALGYREFCLDSWKTSMPQCSYFQSGNQIWRLDPERHWLINGGDGERCLTANFDNQTLTLTTCNEDMNEQKWSFTYENKSALDDWDNIYGYKKFVYPNDDLNYGNMLPLEYSEC